MRQPSILDVLRAVRDVGPTHPEVRAWWYAPGQRVRLQGVLAGEEARDALEVVIETDVGEPERFRNVTRDGDLRGR